MEEEKGYRVHLENVESMTFEEKLSGLKKEIVNFFSQDDNQSKIKQIYEKVRTDHDFAEKEILCEDLNSSLSIYNEYIGGMTKFLSEAAIDDEWQKKYEKATKNDKPFIESIFGGTNNEPIITVIRESLGNLEVLIDFIPRIDRFVTESAIYQGNPGYDLYTESVYEFSKTMIEHVINEFCKLDPHEVPIEQLDTQPNQIYNQFKLFL